MFYCGWYIGRSSKCVAWVHARFDVRVFRFVNISPEIQKKETHTNKNQSIWDTIDQKANWFKNETNTISDINKIPQDINDFYNNFIRDSIIQISKIDFSNFIGIITECDTTIKLNKDNWEYIEFDLLLSG